MRFRLKGVVQTPYDIPDHALKHPDNTQLGRPLPIKVIAFYQLLRGFLLAVVAVSLWGNTAVDIASHTGLRTLLYLVTQKNLAVQHMSLAAVLLIVLSMSAWCLSTGVGLLLLSKWAHRAIIVSSSFAILRLLIFFTFMQAGKVAIPDTTQIELSVLLLLDTIVISSLMNHTHLFGKDV